MQGWTPDFIPKLTADAVAMKVIDQIITVPGSEAIRWAESWRERKAFSSGSPEGRPLQGPCARVRRRRQERTNILAMLPDTGERYLSTPLFANVPAEMTPEELDISRSTPSAQFGT
jgi:cysteine synthase